MRVVAHLTFAGTCEEAFALYAQIFGADASLMLKYGETAMKDGVAPGWRNKIVHATLTFGATELMGTDVPPEEYEAPRGVHVVLEVSSVAEAERVFEALAAGGRVELPLDETFWSPAFGMVVDRFGIPWEINCAAGDSDPVTR